MAKAKKKAAAAESNLRHPRESLELIGQTEAEKQLLQAHQSGRMPHAWLVTGPKGIGKATLAYRFARFLLSGGSGQGLDADMQLPAVRRVQNQSHADLMVLESADGDIGVEEARHIAEFLSLTPAESPWRVVIIDSIDDMNRNAANAILKTLEEPPARAVLLLVSHNPGTLLPTIRSRCRVLKATPLAREDFSTLLREHVVGLSVEMQQAYYLLSGGSPGLALFLADQEAVALYHAVLELFPHGNNTPDWTRAHALADQMNGVANTVRFEAMQHVLQYLFRQLVRAKLGERDATEDVLEGEDEVLAHLAGFKSMQQWLDLWQESAILLQDTRRIHLDRKQVLLNIIGAMQPQGSLAA